MSEDPKIMVESAQALSPHRKAVHEAGVMLIKESIQTGRDFCKSMVTTCFSAIPVYIALLRLFVPENKIIPDKLVGSWFLPIGFFLVAAIIFAGGYLPGRSSLSIDLPDEVASTMNRAVNRRFWLGVAGFALLCTGIMVSAVVLVVAVRS